MPARHEDEPGSGAAGQRDDATLSELQTRGEFSAGDARVAAALIAAALDGLQLQWPYDLTVDVEGALAYLLKTLGVTPVAGADPLVPPTTVVDALPAPAVRGR